MTPQRISRQQHWALLPLCEVFFSKHSCRLEVLILTRVIFSVPVKLCFSKWWARFRNVCLSRYWQLLRMISRRCSYTHADIHTHTLVCFDCHNTTLSQLRFNLQTVDLDLDSGCLDVKVYAEVPQACFYWPAEGDSSSCKKQPQCIDISWKTVLTFLALWPQQTLSDEFRVSVASFESYWIQHDVNFYKLWCAQGPVSRVHFRLGH